MGVEVVDLLLFQITNGEDARTTGSYWCYQHLGYTMGVAIASLNVNGLLCHLDELNLLIEDLGIHILLL